MSLTERLYSYNHFPGDLCYCGERKGHVGWLVCVFDPPPKSIDELEAEMDQLEKDISPFMPPEFRARTREAPE